MNWLNKLLSAIFGKKMTHKVSRSERGGEVVSRVPHKDEAGGSIPPPATKLKAKVEIKAEQIIKNGQGKQTVKHKPGVFAKPPENKNPSKKTTPAPKNENTKVSVGPPAPDPFYIIGTKNAWIDSLPAPNDRMDLDDVFKLYPRWNDPSLANNDDPTKIEYHLTKITFDGSRDLIVDPPKYKNYRRSFELLRIASDTQLFSDSTMIFAISEAGIPFFKERWGANKVGYWFVLGRDEAKAIKALKDWYKENYQ